MKPQQERNRVPEGVPTGGQYATERKAESTTASLMEAEQAAPEGEVLLTTEHLPLVDRAISRSMSYYKMSATEVIHGQSGDDIRQDAYIDVLDRINRGTRTKNPTGYVFTIVANKFEQAFRGNMGRANRKANSIYTAREMVRVQQLGRSLTVQEEKELEQEIYDGWQGSTKSRPARNFRHRHLTSVPVALDSRSGLDDGKRNTLMFDALGFHAPSVEDEFLRDEAAEDEELEEMVREREAMSAGEGAREDAVKIRAADLMFTRANVPLVEAGSLPQAHRARYKKAIDDHPGGLQQAIADYNNGEDSPATEAIFGAWQSQDLTAEDKDQIIRIFESSGGAYRDDLWRITMSKADARREKVRREREAERATAGV